MKIYFFSILKAELSIIKEQSFGLDEVVFKSEKLTRKSIDQIEEIKIISVRSKDVLDRETTRYLVSKGLEFITTRTTGFDPIDLASANEFGVKVAHVSAYSPFAIAKHALLLLLGLNRKLIPPVKRIEKNNFSIDGLLGENLSKQTVGIIGTGKIENAFIKIWSGFGCDILAYDLNQNPEIKAIENVQYTSLEKLLTLSGAIFLHLHLSAKTHHIIDEANI